LPVMGILKKIGMGIGIVVGVIFALGIVAAMTTSSAPAVVDQYAGLTEQQIRSVKLFAESCQSNATFAGVYGPEHEKVAQEKCDMLVAQKIAN